MCIFLPFLLLSWPINSKSNCFCSKLRFLFLFFVFCLLWQTQYWHSVVVIWKEHWDLCFLDPHHYILYVFGRPPNQIAHSKPMNQSERARVVWMHPDPPPFPIRRCQPDSCARVKCRVFCLPSEKHRITYWKHQKLNFHHFDLWITSEGWKFPYLIVIYFSSTLSTEIFGTHNNVWETKCLETFKEVTKLSFIAFAIVSIWYCIFIIYYYWGLVVSHPVFMKIFF